MIAQVRLNMGVALCVRYLIDQACVSCVAFDEGSSTVLMCVFGTNVLVSGPLGHEVQVQRDR